MKKYFVIILGVIFSSCEPNPASEGITLPEMEFAFKVSPDTSYIKLKDTLILKSSISNTLDGDVVVNDGEATIGTYFWYYPYNPITHGGGLCHRE